MKLDYTPKLLLALCVMVGACSSRSEGSDDDAQREPEQADAAITEAPAADSGSAVARECIGRVPGEEFCDGTTVRTCIDGIPAERQCDEHARCVTVGDRVSCACEPGAVDTGSGCQVVSGCAVARGGCDPLTQCSIVAERRTCGACPAGYLGDGERGCEPILNGLVADGGQLTPAFAPDVRTYRVRLSPMREQLSLTLDAASSVQCEVDGTELDPGRNVDIASAIAGRAYDSAGADRPKRDHHALRDHRRAR